MHRIYFDGNDGPDNERYGLWLDKSREDLAKIPGGPREGLMVTIYMIGEIEMEATLVMGRYLAGLDCASSGWHRSGQPRDVGLRMPADPEAKSAQLTWSAQPSR